MMVIFIEVVVFFDLRAEMGRSGGKTNAAIDVRVEYIHTGTDPYEINLKLMESIIRRVRVSIDFGRSAPPGISCQPP